jgi:hypothetical protein
MSNRILSYRGLLADGGQDTILLSTKKGEKGYRITKFQLLGKDVTGANQESVVKIYSKLQSTVDGVVDFNATTLLGAGFYEQAASGSYFGGQIIVFDNVIFNQDIFVTHSDAAGSAPLNYVNYYLELEVLMLSESEATVATLSDIRSNS